AKFAGREYDLPVHREMAEDLLNKLVVDYSFDVAYSEDAELGHAFAVPFEHVIGKRDIPVVPFFTNVYVPPLPTPKRCAALGKAGNTEMLTWAVLFGAIGPRPGALIDYIPTWHHGLAMMRFLPAVAKHAPSAKAMEQYGGFKFKNQGFQFYKHPPADAYGLN